MMEFMMELVIISTRLVNTYKGHENDRGRFTPKSLVSSSRIFIITIKWLSLEIVEILIIAAFVWLNI